MTTAENSQGRHAMKSGEVSNTFWCICLEILKPKSTHFFSVTDTTWNTSKALSLTLYATIDSLDTIGLLLFISSVHNSLKIRI